MNEARIGIAFAVTFLASAVLPLCDTAVAKETLVGMSGKGAP
jgi:hypothetical protein